MFTFLTKNEKTKAKILVLGSANGSGNLGDEAMFESLAYFFYKNFPETKIITDSSSTSYRAPYANIVKVIPAYGSRGISKLIRLIEFSALSLFPRIMKKIVIYYPSELVEYYNEMKNCDYVIISGAGAINSQFRGYGIYGWGSIVLLAKALNKSVYLTGQGIGPFSNKFDELIALKFLSKANYIQCRDKNSYQFLKNNNIEQCSFQMDDATFIPCLSGKNFLDIKMMNGISKPYMVISIHDWYKENKIKLFEILSYITSKYLSQGIQIVLLGNKIKNEMNDIPFLASFKEEFFLGEDNIIILKAPYTASVSKSIISNAKLLITTRYHPAIFAYESQIPTIAIAYDQYYYQKFQGAFMFRKDKKTIIFDYQKLSSPLLENSIEKLEHSHD